MLLDQLFLQSYDYSLSSIPNFLRNCIIARSNKASPCIDTKCATCSIVSYGTQIEKLSAGEPSVGFKRFGKALNFAALSSITDNYNEQTTIIQDNMKFKLMLWSKVVVGKACLSGSGNIKLSSPPMGFDSIMVRPRDYNNDNRVEVVIYEDAACLPQYLIKYKV